MWLGFAASTEAVTTGQLNSLPAWGVLRDAVVACSPVRRPLAAPASERETREKEHEREVVVEWVRWMV
jgi:hypothetical protein